MVDGVNGEEEGGFDPMRYAPWNDQYRLSTISTRMQLRHPLNRARRGTRSTSKKRIISAKIPDCLLAFNDGISFNLSLSLPLTILTSRDLEIYFRPFRGAKEAFGRKVAFEKLIFEIRCVWTRLHALEHGLVGFVLWKIIDFADYLLDRFYNDKNVWFLFNSCYLVVRKGRRIARLFEYCKRENYGPIWYNRM